MGYLVLFLGIAGILGGIGLFATGAVVGGIAILIVAIFFLTGLKTIPEQERWGIERFEAFNRVVGPGLQPTIPLIESIREKVPIWEHPIGLFLEDPWIDFREGGTARLIEPTVWPKISEEGPHKDKERNIKENVKKAIYEIEVYRTAIREAVETALRSCLNNLTVEETLKAIYEAPDEQRGWWQIVKDRFQGLEERIRGWGFAVTRITISDFEWSEEVKETRRAVFEAERNIKVADYAAQAAKFAAAQKALESGGMHGEIRRRLVDEYGYSPEEAEKVAADYVKYFEAARTGRLIDWRGGEGDLYAIIARIVAAFQIARDILSGKKEEGQE